MDNTINDLENTKDRLFNSSKHLLENDRTSQIPGKSMFKTKKT